MAIQILGADGASTWNVDPTMGAARVSLRPGQVDGWSSYAPQSANLTALAASTPLFTLRNTGAKQIVIRRFQLQFLVLTAFTVPQRLEWQLFIARSWTVGDTGGVQLNTASGRHRQGLSSLGMDARMNLGVPITSGTRTNDAHPIATAGMWAGSVGATSGQVSMVTTDAGDHPVVVGTNEGIVLQNAFAMGAGGTGMLYLGIEVAEGQYP
jgi:hypothetical protein